MADKLNFMTKYHEALRRSTKLVAKGKLTPELERELSRPGGVVTVASYDYVDVIGRGVQHDEPMTPRDWENCLAADDAPPPNELYELRLKNGTCGKIDAGQMRSLILAARRRNSGQKVDTYQMVRFHDMPHSPFYIDLREVLLLEDPDQPDAPLRFARDKSDEPPAHCALLDGAVAPINFASSNGHAWHGHQTCKRCAMSASEFLLYGRPSCSGSGAKSDKAITAKHNDGEAVSPTFWTDSQVIAYFDKMLFNDPLWKPMCDELQRRNLGQAWRDYRYGGRKLPNAAPFQSAINEAFRSQVEASPLHDLLISNAKKAAKAPVDYDAIKLQFHREREARIAAEPRRRLPPVSEAMIKRVERYNAEQDRKAKASTALGAAASLPLPGERSFRGLLFNRADCDSTFDEKGE